MRFVFTKWQVITVRAHNGKPRQATGTIRNPCNFQQADRYSGVSASVTCRCLFRYDGGHAHLIYWQPDVHIPPCAPLFDGNPRHTSPHAGHAPVLSTQYATRELGGLICLHFFTRFARPLPNSSTWEFESVQCWHAPATEL